MRAIGEGIIVIPDVHGRDFWREAVDRAEGKHVVFLGDYGDPFPEEGIPAERGVEKLEAIIAQKRSHPDEITLLLGNHDLQYYWPAFPKRRYDDAKASQYTSLFHENRDCFDLTASFLSPNRAVVLTHAGILPEWLKANRTLFGISREVPPDKLFAAADYDKPNDFWQEGADQFLCEALSAESTLRGGTSPYGSMVWADAREMLAATPSPGVFQLFGHSRQHGRPLILESFACVDCSRAFLLDQDVALSVFPK